MSISRNAPCPCGSSKKYKKCCLGKTENNATESAAIPFIMGESDLDDLSNHANDLIRRRQWDEAQRHCQLLQRQFPDEIDADDRFAQLYQAQENWPKAHAHAQAALEKARQNPEKFHTELISDLETQVAFLKEKAL